MDDWDDEPSTPAPNTNSGYTGTRTAGGGGSRACHKCGEEGHMARECPSAPSGGGGSRACYKCNEEGHMARDCPSAPSGGGGSRACRKCNEEGHMARDCPNAPSGGGGSRACHKCGEEGHMARDCPSAPSGGGGSRACHKCGEEGHMARDCPSAPSGGGGSRACHKCNEEGHMARDCPTTGGSGSSKGCRRCGEDGHFVKDCPNPPPEPKDGELPKEQYEPPAMTEGDAVFQEHKESHSGSGINFDKYSSIPVEVVGNKFPNSVKSFEELGLRKLVLENIKKCGYIKPTPIQQHATPILMGDRDVMACAQTGSGKTAAFLMPIINQLMADPDLTSSGMSPATPEALIVAPTRELAIQIAKEANTYACDSIVRCKVVYGGTTMGSCRNAIASGVNILVATPGRLLGIIKENMISLKNIKFFVLDEADRMLDMGFMPDIEKIIEYLPPKDSRTSGMFSATYPPEIAATAEKLLKEDLVYVTIGLVGGACSDVEQLFLEVDRKSKRDKLVELLSDIKPADKVLIFCGSKKGADFLATTLCNDPKYSATSIHGDRLQSQREQALREFTSGRRSILVATAVAARGLDIPKVTIVINYDLPSEIDEYVHRIGRTGRVGNVGKAISFYDPEKDTDLASKLVPILMNANQPVPDFLGGSGCGLEAGMNGMSLQNGNSAQAVGGGADANGEEEW